MPIIYYFLFAYYVKIKPLNNKYTKISYLLITLYLLIYYVSVKLTGLYAYNIEWYPYIIFDQESIQTILGINNDWIGLLLLIFINITVYVIYMLLYIFIKKTKQKKVML